MKKSVKIFITATMIAAASVSSLAAKPAKRVMKPAKSWTLYMPGKGNAKDAVKDLNKAGWLTSDLASKHLSLVNTTDKKVKALKINTLDGVNDAFVLPLSGKEKKVTVIFKAKGAVNPDQPTTPYGLFYAYLMNGEYQSTLRHNASHQIKGSKGSSKFDKKTNMFVNDWHDWRFVFDIPEGDASKMTAQCFLDGVLVHKDICKQQPGWTDGIDWDFEKKSEEGHNYLSGKGHYLEFGENDNSTNGYARYAYILTILDEDVSDKSLEDLGAIVKADLVKNPEIIDVDPPSKRPANPPAGIVMKGSECNGKDEGFVDANAITDGKINLSKMPITNTSTSVITATPVVPELNFACVVDASGATPNSVKTIAEAIEKVPSGSAIKVMPGLYYEKLVITKPGISLIGTDPTSTIIYGYEANTGGINGNILVDVNLLPANLSTEPGVKAEIPNSPAPNCYFNAANITFYNRGGEWNEKWGGSERRSITLAIKGVDQCVVENCIFLGLQDSTYFRSGRMYLKNCYIQGTVDYLCGGATCFFDNCDIYTIKYGNGGIIYASAGADTGYKSTAAFANGNVYYQTKFRGDASFKSAAKKVTLARGTWVGGSATGEKITGKSVLIDCEMEKIFYPADKVYADWDITNTAAKCFYKEYNTKGEGADPERPQLNASEAKLLSNPESVLGFKPVLK